MLNCPILYAEDEEHDVELLTMAFKAQQIANPVCSAKDGQEAIEYLSGAGQFADRTRHPMPGLVLLDIKMPRVSGLEALRWIRRDPRVKLLPVFVITSSFLAEDVQAAYEACANAFLVKPGTYDELKEIAGFIKAWLRHAQIPPVLGG